MTVAIKQMYVPDMQEIIDATDSYNRGVTLLPRLQHQSLPRLYGYFTDEDHWYGYHGIYQWSEERKRLQRLLLVGCR